MANYKWVKSDSFGLYLCQENFGNFSWPLIGSLDKILEEKLEENQICNELDIDYDSYRYELRPFTIRHIDVTAPLYVYEDGDFRLEAEAYTDETIDPAQYEEVLETYKRCRKEVIEEQRQKFLEIFNNATLDGGMTALIKINSSEFDPEHLGFMEKYIPEDDFIRIAEHYAPFDRKQSDVVFMKLFDAKGTAVKIKVPDFYKGLVIGVGGKNINRVAKIINASRLHVGCSPTQGANIY